LQLQLSGNCLTTLQPLSQLQHLTRLDVSHNLLSQVSVQQLTCWQQRSSN
jgi:Leucine-rich repeat (LRR) protein